jgi:hypothetical protein
MSALRDAWKILEIEEAVAWFEYLEATRGETAPRYLEIEAWAWARLKKQLRVINARRADFVPAA